ncbi:MAG: hypothetical protein ACLP50_33445 [Solirubrobacteraceae bacterium]
MALDVEPHADLPLRKWAWFVQPGARATTRFGHSGPFGPIDAPDELRARALTQERLQSLGCELDAVVEIIRP